MGSDWLKDRFNLSVPDIQRVVGNACKYSAWQHADDVCGEVLLRLQRRYLNDPTYFKDQRHVLRRAYWHARSCLWQTLRKMQRLEFYDPRELPEPLTRARTTTSEDDIAAQETREWLLSLLATAAPLAREVFRLYSEGMNGKEIAAKVRKSEATVSRCLMDALELLRQALGEK